MLFKLFENNIEIYTPKVMGATILDSVPHEEFWDGSASLWDIMGTSCWNYRSKKTLFFVLFVFRMCRVSYFSQINKE